MTWPSGSKPGMFTFRVVSKKESLDFLLPKGVESLNDDYTIPSKDYSMTLLLLKGTFFFIMDSQYDWSAVQARLDAMTDLYDDFAN